jgi:hypothetical protein
MRTRFTILVLTIISTISFASITQAAGLSVTTAQKFNVNVSRLNMAGDVNNAGTLQTGTGAIKLGGNWTNTGVFIAGSSEVAFKGPAPSTIKGENYFFNFTCTQPGKQLSFEAGKTQTIDGAWTLSGVAGGLVALRSTVAGIQWMVKPQGTRNISFVDVEDSNNISPAVINAVSSIDSGNNTNWSVINLQAAHYTLDDGSGAIATDSSGNGNHGAINGATWTTGKSGSALSFDGNDYVQIPGLMGQPQNITLSAWAQLNAKDTSGAEVISLGDHVAIRLDSSNGAAGFYYDGTTWRGTATGVSYAGTGWHHFVYVVDDNNNIQKVYVDGIEKGSTAYTQSISYAGLGFNTFIGRHANGSNNYDFNGLVDDVHVYNEALSAQEVLDLYNQSSGLVSHWKLDEGGGTNATDAADGNNGIINGAAWTTGISGGALSLNGVNDYVDLGNPANLQPGIFSLSVWFKTTATGGRIIRKRTYGYGLDVLPAGKIIFWINDATAASFTAISPNAYNDNTWHHAVGVYGGSMVKLYIDGSQVASASAGTIFYGVGAIAIGRDGNNPGSYFKGLVDDVRIFQSELSAQEVLDLYNQSSGLVSHWKFDEGLGTNATDAADGNNGIINGATWTTGKIGGALSLDGIDDNVQIPGLLGQPQNITISAWANLSDKDTSGAEVISLGDHVAIRLDGAGGNGARGYYYDGTTWRSTVTGVSYAGTGWHYFVYVVDDINNIQKVYVDGVEQGSTTYTQSITYAGLGSDTFVGRHGNGSSNYDFSGIIDDVRVYNRVLGAEEVQGLYNNVSALVTTASRGFIGINNGDAYTSVTPPGAATPIYPTTFILHSFKAGADDGRVVLTWETSGEADNAGFNLYRSRRRSGTYTKVNNTLIDAKGDVASGGSYSFEDQPGNGNFYYYKLESVDYDGVVTVHGPEKARVKSGDNASRRSKKARR